MHDVECLAAGIGAFVHVSQGVDHHDADRDRLGPTHTHAELAGARAHVTEVPSFDELDHHVRLAGRVVGRLHDLGDARVLELGLDASLVQEAGQEGAVLLVLASNRLHDAGAFSAFEAAGRGQVNLAHAAAGDSLE